MVEEYVDPSPAARPPHAKFMNGSYRQPEDANERVWRYMDLPKLIAMLDTKFLYLARLDTLGDAHEGTLTKEDFDRRQQRYGTNPDLIAGAQYVTATTRTTTYVSCWHMNKRESHAMWRVYCGLRGVAIRTTYQRLADATMFDPNWFIGMVTYGEPPEPRAIPYDWIFPIMHKRIPFADEREVRLVKSAHRMMPAERRPPGIHMRWDIEAVAEAIVVHPDADDWYHDVVRAVLSRFAPGLRDRLCWSDMKGPALY